MIQVTLHIKHIDIKLHKSRIELKQYASLSKVCGLCQDIKSMKWIKQVRFLTINPPSNRPLQ